MNDAVSMHHGSVMPVFTVSYDLTKEKPEHDYQVLHDELNKLGAHKVQYSYWLVNYQGTAKQLSDLLSKYMHDDDRLWVARMHPNKVNGEEYEWTRAFKGTKDWLKKNPPT